MCVDNECGTAKGQINGAVVVFGVAAAVGDVTFLTCGRPLPCQMSRRRSPRSARNSAASAASMVESKIMEY
jgi:hypothetical protein